MKTKRDGCAAVSVKNKIYVFGGFYDVERLSSAEVYDITTQKWTQLPQMKQKRGGCVATAVGNRIYIVGGQNETGFLSSCEVFNSSANTWLSTITDMNEKKAACQAVTIGTKIYVMGGTNYTTIHSSLEAFETISENSDDILSTGSDRFAQLSISQNYVERSSSMTVHQRVLFLEKNVGVKHDPSALLIRRIEFLEKNIYGESKDKDVTNIKRMNDLHASFFGK